MIEYCLVILLKNMSPELKPINKEKLSDPIVWHSPIIDIYSYPFKTAKECKNHFSKNEKSTSYNYNCYPITTTNLGEHACAGQIFRDRDKDIFRITLQPITILDWSI